MAKNIIIFHAFHSLSPLQSRQHWANQNQIVCLKLQPSAEFHCGFFVGTVVPSYPEVTEVSLFGTSHGSPCLRELGKFRIESM